MEQRQAFSGDGEEFHISEKRWMMFLEKNGEGKEDLYTLELARMEEDEL